MDNFKFLGVIVSTNLSWKVHVLCVRNKLRACLALLYKSRDNLTRSCMLTLFFSFASSHLHHCIFTWCTTNFCLLYSLQRCCNKILRIIFFRNSRSNCDDMYKKFESLKILDTYELEVGCFVYKFFHICSPNVSLNHLS